MAASVARRIHRMTTLRWSCLPLLLILLVAPSMQQTRDKLDLVYVVDGSDSVGEANFELVKTTILNTVTPLMTGNLYVGFVHYSTRLNKAVGLTSDPNELRQEVTSTTFVGGETNTNVGVQWGLSVLMTTSAQAGAPKDMIVIVDGVSRFPSDTQSIANFTRGMGISISAIGVGNTITQEELLNIAGVRSQVYTAPSYAALPAIDLRLTQVDNPTTPQPTTPQPTTPQPTTPQPTTPRPTTPRPTTPQPTTPRPTTPQPTTPQPTTPRPTTPPPTTPRPTTPPTTVRTSPTTIRRTTPTTRPTVPTRPPVTTPRPTLPTRPPVTTPSRPVITTTRTTTPRMTTTTRRAPVTPYVEPFLDEGLCESAKIVNGIGYRAHPTDADKYVQCYFPSESLTLAVVRECPFGLLWNDRARYCDTYLRVRLAGDPCRSKQCGGSHPHEGNCRTFYNCEGGRSVPRCCPGGYLYDALNQRCAPCKACTEPCPAMCSSVQFACTKYPVFDDYTVYRKWTRNGDVIVPCANGTFFDLSACQCIKYNVPNVCTADVDVPFNPAAAASGTGVNRMEVSYDDVTFAGNVGRFNGVKSRVNIKTNPQSPFDRPLVLRMTYREAEKITRPIALASTSRCGLGGLVLMSLERGSIKIEMSSYGHTPIIFRLPTAGFKEEDSKEVMVFHDREYLTVAAYSGKLAYLRRAKVAVLPYMHCGLDFGNSEWMDGFNGTISRVQLLRCVPSDFRMY